MAKHKFLSVKPTIKEGGYFYRWYPNITEYRQRKDGEDHPKRKLQLFPAPDPPTISNNVRSLYGKFLDKYEDKGTKTIELELTGKVLFSDTYTKALEQRVVTSILIIAVEDVVYDYPFEKGHLYRITTDQVNEFLTPE